MLTHVVLMKFTDAKHAPEAKERLEALGPVVEEIRGVTVGLDAVRGEASYDLALITQHESLEELKAYQAHPAHLEVAAWLRPLLAARATVDF